MITTRWFGLNNMQMFGHFFRLQAKTKQNKQQQQPQNSLVRAPGARIACWFERRTRDRKVASSHPGRSDERIFFSRVNFVCWPVLSVSVTVIVLPQWYVKDTSHSAKSAGGRLHLRSQTPLTQWSRSGRTMPLSALSVGIYPETSSHATC